MMQYDKKRKKKPIYSVIQNTVYVFKNIWENGQKSLAISTLARIPVSIILSVIALYMPKIIVDRLEFSESIQQMIAVVTVLLVGTMMFELLNNLIEAKEWSLGARMCGYYNRHIYQKYLNADYGHFEDPKFQNISKKAREACQGWSDTAMQLPRYFTSFMTDLFLFLIFAGVITILNPLILLLLSVTVFINYFLLRAVRNYEHSVKEKRAAISRKIWYLASMSTQLAHGKDIRLYGMGKWFHEMSNIFMGECQDVKKDIEHRGFRVSLVNLLMVLLRDGGAYLYLIHKAVAIEISAGEFVLYFAAIGQFAGWFSGLIDTWLNIHTASLQFCDIREFLEYANKTNRGKGIELPLGSDGLRIELRNVTYQYPAAEKPTIKNLDLKIEAGEKIALVGLNGAGKTTLVKLICGMYHATEGVMFLNGHRMDEYNIEEYYTLFSAVFQQFRFLPLSIAHNIAMVSKEQADIQKLNRCIELSGLTEKINQLAEGIDTPLIKAINPDGTELSGGEQQKLMLARAIYKDAPVLILDEPTAALDPIAESEMYMKYNEIAKNKTSVFISHRLTSTRFCDRIILLSDGEIAEVGTHDELIRKAGKYAELYEIQSHYYNE
jgi:ABC-type multidrug transport system fused ATPase/permease subunit